MRSMTGFGRGVVERDGEHVAVEARSVNHRFLDIKLRGPISPAMEDQVMAKIRASIERGSVTVWVKLASRGGANGSRIDREAARRSHAALVDLAAVLGVPGPDLALVLAQPGVVVASEGDDRDAIVAPFILEAVDLAVDQLQQSRVAEGRALERELTSRLDELARHRDAMDGLASGLAETYQRRLSERLARLVGDTTIDAGRLAQEVALLADRTDIAEELVRLKSHIEQTRVAIAGSKPSGRALDFFAQELGRELNTIGAKSQLAEISTAVILAKSTLEKFREQVQNVE